MKAVTRKITAKKLKIPKNLKKLNRLSNKKNPSILRKARKRLRISLYKPMRIPKALKLTKKTRKSAKRTKINQMLALKKRKNRISN